MHAQKEAEKQPTRRSSRINKPMENNKIRVHTPHAQKEAEKQPTRRSSRLHNPEENNKSRKIHTQHAQKEAEKNPKKVFVGGRSRSWDECIFIRKNKADY